MFPSMQVYVHQVNLIEKKTYQNFQKLEILNQKVAREFIFFLPEFGYLFIFIKFIIYSSKWTSHIQEIIMQKNMFSCS